MTMITRLSESDHRNRLSPSFGLSQRGRASIEVLAAIQKSASQALRDKAAANFAADPRGAALIATHGPDADVASVRQTLAEGREIAERDSIYRLERFFQRLVTEEIYNRGIPAVEERRAQFEAFLSPLPDGSQPGLELDPSIPAPKYYTHTEWHLEPGGWDGYDLYGALFSYVLGPIVFRHGGYAAVPPKEDIGNHRPQLVQQLRKESYARIYEPGCGGVAVTSALNAAHPQAEIVGSDLSALLLKMGRMIADRRGLNVTLKQRELLDGGEPDESFDAVVTYALHHELPPKVNRALFAEIFRVLKPGGDFVMGDPPPFRAVDPFHAVILDWDTEHRGEPFFTATLLEDWDRALTDIGFTDVQSYPLGRNGYPWITRATKPDTQAALS